MDPLITMDPSFTTRASFTIAPKFRPRSLTKTRESWRFLSPKEVPFWTVGDFFWDPCNLYEWALNHGNIMGMSM